MAKYSDSSDSDYDRRIKNKSRRRSRSDSVSSDSRDSSSARYHRKRASKSTYSRSRRSASPSNRKGRHRDRHHRSRSRSRRRSSSGNRRRRSRSKSYIKEYTSKPRQSRSSSSDSSHYSNKKQKILANKLLKNNSKVPAAEKKELLTQVEREEPIEVPDQRTLEEINKEGFNPKKFASKFKEQEEKIVIDLQKQTIKVPEKSAENKQEANSIFHHNLFQREEQRIEKWVKDLFQFRQKALQQGAKKP